MKTRKPHLFCVYTLCYLAFASLGFRPVGVLAQNTLVSESFESYPVGSWPYAWSRDGNAGSDSLRNLTSSDPVSPGNKVLQLYGVVGGWWGALAYHPCEFPSQFTLSARVYNGNEVIPPGGHVARAGIDMKQGSSWPNPGIGLINFHTDGTIMGPSWGRILQTYSTGRWYNIEIDFLKRSNDILLTYRIDGVDRGSSTIPISSASLDHVNLVAYAGTVCFDNVVVRAYQPQGIPAPPSNLVATATLTGQVDVSWQDNSHDEHGFRVQRRTGVLGGWSTIATVLANVTTHQDTNVAAGATYCYRVCAYNSVGNSGYSNEAEVGPQKHMLFLSSTLGGYVSYPAEGTFEYDQGSLVMIEAQPDSGYRFTHWSGSIYSSSNPEWITLNASQNVRANFEKIVVPAPQPGIRLSGRVLHGQNRTALANVTVTAGGQTTSTNSQGNYSFASLPRASTIALTASRSGYTNYTTQLRPSAGAVSLVHDLSLVPSSPGKPAVTRLTGKYDHGLFLAGLSVSNEYTAQVQWNGTPGTVEFYANNALKRTINGTNAGGKATLDMGKDFSGAYGTNAILFGTRIAES